MFSTHKQLILVTKNDSVIFQIWLFWYQKKKPSTYYGGFKNLHGRKGMQWFLGWYCFDKPRSMSTILNKQMMWRHHLQKTSFLSLSLQQIGQVSSVSSTLVCPPSLSQICAQVYSHRCSHRSKIIHINAGFSNSSLLSHCYQSALRLRKSVHNSSLSSIENISLLVVVSWATKKDLHTKSIQLGGATPTPYRRLSESAGDYMLLPSSSVLLATVVTHSVMWSQQPNGKRPT